MSEKEDFLSRWSRRKQEVAREAKLPRNDEATEAKAPQEKAAIGNPQAALAQDTQSPEPLFDLSKLPSLDSIGAGTDIRAFMQPGVPTALSHAALRRVWSADPAIRDFIGLSENAWDFTKPESIAGFGELLPIDDVKQLLSQILPDDIQRPAEAEPSQHAALQHEDTSGEQASKTPETLSDEQEFVTANSQGEPRGEVAPHCTQNDLAPQQEQFSDEEPLEPSKPRHGGALPT